MISHSQPLAPHSFQYDFLFQRGIHIITNQDVLFINGLDVIIRNQLYHVILLKRFIKRSYRITMDDGTVRHNPLIILVYSFVFLMKLLKCMLSYIKSFFQRYNKWQCLPCHMSFHCDRYCIHRHVCHIWFHPDSMNDFILQEAG